MALKKKIRRTQNAIINKIRGTKKTDAEREKEIKEQVAEQTRRMRDIKGILEAIDFSLSELPSEELEKKMSSGQSVPDYELVRKMAVAYLDHAKATEMDTSRIDESIRYAANAFAEGVKYGQLNKARWGMVAMMHLIQYEREDVDETDRGQFAEMAVRKERQAENYVTMLKECKKLDNREKRKAKLNSLYRKFVDEFEAKRAEFNRLRETEEGEYAMGELEENAHHPINLSMLASELDALLTVISRKDMDILLLRGEIREINRQIALIQSTMDQIYLALSEDSYVEDQDLLARIEEVNRERQEAVSRIIVENERMDTALTEHQTAMKQILDSPASAKKTAQNLVYLERKEQEEIEKKERMEANRARRRAEKERKIEELKRRQREEQEERELDRTLDDLEQELEEGFEEAYMEDALEEVEAENYQYNEDY